MKKLKEFGLFFVKFVFCLGLVSSIGWSVLELGGAKVRFGSAYLEDTLTGGVNIGTGRLYAWDSIKTADMNITNSLFLGDADEIIWRTSAGLSKVASVFGILTFNGDSYDFQDISGGESYVLIDSSNGVTNNVKVINNYVIAYDSSVTASTTNITPRSSYLVITGTTTIASLVPTGLNEGAIVYLRFTANVTVENDNAVLGEINLAGAVNFSATDKDFLTLILAEGEWYEVSRSVN